MTQGFRIITSAAYVDQELAIEFGKMPPAFLPLAAKRLFEHQVNRVGQALPIYLTVPDDFSILDSDARLLSDLGVKVLRIPVDLSLGESVVFALNLISLPDQPVHILHGDTLYGDEIGFQDDEIGVSEAGESYAWAEVQLKDGVVEDIYTLRTQQPSEHGHVACGYFSFSHSAALVRAITRARGSFVDGIKLYSKDHTLRARHIEEWLDFGHLQTYFRSRRAVSTARSFNRVSIGNVLVRKESEDVQKIQAEAFWLDNVPTDVEVFSARIIASGQSETGAYYETVYEYLPTLSELYVFGKLGKGQWARILGSCREFLEACHGVQRETPGQGSILHQLVIDKTRTRLREFSEQTGFDVGKPLRYGDALCPSLMDMVAEIEKHIRFDQGSPSCIMHGDFCFSNIMYNGRVQRIVAIDPRGYLKAGTPSVYGDQRYDLAKFYHSVIGRYDDIIAGRYVLTRNGDEATIAFNDHPHQAWLLELMRGFAVHGRPIMSDEIHAITTSLFLSMLPLHADRPDRQAAFVVNALRLFAQLGAPT